MSDFSHIPKHKKAFNQTRIETLTDGIYAIIMTILIFDLKPPNLDLTNNLFAEFQTLLPFLISFFLSFAVLFSFWMTHHFLFHIHVKTLDRALVRVNILHLAFISLIPFCTKMLSQYSYNPISTISYGINAGVLALINILTFSYVWNTKGVADEHLNSEIKFQVKIRLYTTLAFNVLGIALAFVDTRLSLICYFIPVLLLFVPKIMHFFADRFAPKELNPEENEAIDIA